MKKTSAPISKESPAKQLEAFIAKYDPAVAKLTRACRSALRKRLPTANELVYDNYQFLAIGYGPNERTSECVVSLAVSPKGPALCFIHGATLPDPGKVLFGGGNQVRFARLERAATLSEPRVEALLRAALKQAKTPMPKTGKGVTIIKSISAKQRPRRKPEKPATKPARRTRPRPA